MESATEISRQTPIWSYSPLSRYAVPGEPSTEALGRLRRGWKTVVGALRRSRAEETAPEERNRPSPEVLAGLLPCFDVEAATVALAAALEDWPAGDGSVSPTRVVVGPPGSGTRQVIEELARRRGWMEVPPPPRIELLEDTDAARQRLAGLDSETGRPAVIAELQRWLLRSERGLPLMRRLLERMRDPPAPALIGCDSWAWSFLDLTLGIRDLLGEPLVLDALDAPALSVWLGEPFRTRGLACRPMEKPDEMVFPDPSPGTGVEREANGESASPVPSSPLLVRLASASRGSPGVALELWRRSLRLAKEQTRQDSEARGDRRATVWIAPVEESGIAVPSRLELSHRLMLHTILLHGGLERDLLAAVLPLPRHEVLRRLRDLGREGLVEESGAEVSIPIAACVAVRDYLEAEGFMVDGF